jgi:predicted transposase/invertase (TIGR01784 family)
MPDEPLHQPHDKLFKSTFGDPANAAAFLREQISSGISARLDWERLRLEPGSFVDSQFRSSESDLLFSSSLEGTDCLIYVLFEHQRVLDPWIALRLLRYMVRIWEGFRRKQPQAVRLPVILPVVLSQNALRWELAPRFAALLDIPPELAEESAAFIPDFIFKLVQLADLPFEKIVGTPAGILVLRTLKAEQIEKLLGSEVWDESLIQQALPTFEMILRYILSQTEIDKTSFAHRVRAIQSSEIKDITMTLAQQFHQEGLQKGLQKGLQEGQQRGLEKGLQEGQQRGLEKGLQEGQQKGLLIGKIQAFEEFLELPVRASEVLETESLEKLAAICEGLHRDYEERFKRS